MPAVVLTCSTARARSKVLGTCVLLGGLAFKLPQILKLQKNKSADGVSVIASACAPCPAHVHAHGCVHGEDWVEE